MRGADGARLLATAALLLIALPEARAQSIPRCDDVVVADAGVAPSEAVVALDLDASFDAPAHAVAGSPASGLVAHVTVLPNRGIAAVLPDADPATLGPDRNGGAGPGGVFELDDVTGSWYLVSDGTACTCPVPAFVDPVGAAHDGRTGMLVVVDPDADPSVLGPDTSGFAGHGAVFAVGRATGALTVVADGTRGPLPPGRRSVFEDPIAAAFARDGRLFVVDQLAEPFGPGSVGALFEIDVGTGEAHVVVAGAPFVAPRDVAVSLEPSGFAVLVLDRLAGGLGRVFRIDPDAPAGSRVTAALGVDDFVEPSGIVVDGRGDVLVLDSAADPLGVGRTGAIFRIDPSLSGWSIAATPPEFAVPWSLSLLEPLAIESVVPASGDAGSRVVVVVDGGPFVGVPAVDVGEGIGVEFVTRLDATRLEVQLAIDATAARGERELRLVDPHDGLAGSRCDAFTVLEPAPCSDADGDGYGAPGSSLCPNGAPTDCDDTDPDRSPGAIERCNGLDDDCDGLPEDATPPAQPPRLLVSRTELAWTTPGVASDVARGLLDGLLAARGDFAAAQVQVACLAAGTMADRLAHGTAPPPGGEWFLVRARSCASPGSWDSGDPRQLASRDPALSAAPAGCP